MHIFYKFYNLLLSLTCKMHPNFDFDRLWKQIVDEILEDNIEEEIMRYLREMLLQAENNNQPKRRRIINRNREDRHSRLLNDSFYAISNHDSYFRMRFDVVGRMGLSPLHIRILAYGSPVDSVNENVRITECTTIQCLEAFVKGVNEIFGDKYLRRPNNNDINCLLQIGEAQGFPGLLGSIDCMHWEWKNCPVA
ncbi:uncharacterized protein LOC114402026 [Glycine soja]|uniref:uncharacterized protein LOC114402026 n=1 Tax=Glycine soja TaxID=3848 RepID=UPI00103F5A6D|nr:uncharacterized protein LOC114402026 [Glycine soja]